MGNKRPIYVIISKENQYFIRKYLPKVEKLTNIKQNTLSKHFSTHNTSYKNNNWEVIKVVNVDLDSFNIGNKHNFINSKQEYE